MSELAEAKKLNEDFLKELGWEEAKLNGRKVLRIPYMNEDREICAVRYRHSLDGDFKFSWRRGDKTTPYGLWRLEEAKEKGYIALVEGETDSVALWQNGFPALGVPGGGNWREEWAKYLKGLRAFVWQEPDEAGKRFVKKVAESLNKSCFVIRTDEAKDVCELLNKHPHDFAQQFQPLLNNATQFELKEKKVTLANYYGISFWR